MDPSGAPQFDQPHHARHRAPVNEPATHREGNGIAYTPLPRIERRRRGPRRAAIVGALALTAVVAGIGMLSLISERHSSLPPSALAGAVNQPAATQVLLMSSQDLDREATADAKMALARGEVPPVLRDAPAEVRQQIASGERQLYSVRLMDFADEDGDAVSVAVNGWPFGELILANAGARLTVPLKPGERADLVVTAVRDGGGGVTLRAISSRGELRTRVMAVGESESWTVAFQ